MKKQTGFTLIEILVVIFVIGLVSSLTIFAMGGFGEDHKLESAMKLLTTRLRMAHMEAVFEQEEVGFAIDDRGYRFYKRATARDPWRVIADESVFKSDVLPKHSALVVSVEGQLLQLSQNTPQVVLAQSHVKPFSIQLVGLDQQAFMIEANEQGDIAYGIQ